jgi:hypothetical protein
LHWSDYSFNIKEFTKIGAGSKVELRQILNPFHKDSSMSGHGHAFDPTVITSDPTLQVTATTIFALAITHTFLVKRFENLAHKYPEGSVGENFFHLMAEVEVVMGFWAGLLVLALATMVGFDNSISYLETLNFTEPAFVFVIMSMAGTRPVLKLAETMIIKISALLPLPRKMSFYMTTLILGPLLGSFITEPASMTVTALILLDAFYKQNMSRKLMYATIGLLFVNVSIGGTLTHFAAPPVLMVAGKWGWDISYMIGHFGYKAAIAVVISTITISIAFAKELKGEIDLNVEGDAEMRVPWWIIVIHLIFLFLVVRTAHHMVFFMGLFLFFLGFIAATKEYQDEVKLKESMLVAFFLGGLVVLGSMQAWWLQPLLGQLGDLTLFLGATGLTAITDNAALTYLGSLVEGLPESSKYFLVAGAVTGGGLTVIANAPNPAGYGILKDSFGEKGISPLGLLAAGLFPTFISLLAFQFLPSF